MNRDLANKDLAISKLVILAIVKNIPAITMIDLVNAALETLYMDYFTFIQSFEELKRDHLLAVSIRKNEAEKDAQGKLLERCDITAQGLTILATLEKQIPLHIKTYLAQMTEHKSRDLKHKNEVKADFEPDGNGQFKVSLCQQDGLQETVRLSLTIPDKKMAERICRQWLEQPGSTYIALLALLAGENNLVMTGTLNETALLAQKE